MGWGSWNGVGGVKNKHEYTVYGNYQATSDIGSEQAQKSYTGTGVNFRPEEAYCFSNDFTGLAKSELEKQTNYPYLVMALYITMVQVTV